MAVISNLNTAQTPITSGLTGLQAVKWIAADRVYVKTKDGAATPITVKSNGTKPTGYTDLGIVNGKVRVTYEKTDKEIRTGLDQILRARYVDQRTATFEFVLSQFDDAVVKEVAGVNPSTITSGSVYQFAIGTEDVVEKALILVSQNKLDGKEWQLSYTIEDNSDETVIRVRASLPAFTWGSGEALFLQTAFA
jgi:hypothetical protein